MTLGRDRFYTYDQDSFRTTCYAYNCKSLSSAIQTVVGNWSASGGAPPYSLATLRAYPWTFKKSTAACPASSGPAAAATVSRTMASASTGSPGAGSATGWLTGGVSGRC